MMRVVGCEGSRTDAATEIIRKLGGIYGLIETRDQAMNADFDAVLLLGGRDISPFLYGQKMQVSCQKPDVQRDVREWFLARRAIADGKPIMGICRGHQMLAAACGGTLHQDIYDETSIDHPTGWSHDLDFCSAPLAAVLPTRKVNSLHHQAVRFIPPGFELAASCDGIVEAIWRPGALGIQWHPEMLYDRNRRWLDLFAWFLEGAPAL